MSGPNRRTQALRGARSEGIAAQGLTVYDIGSDNVRPATQADIDQLEDGLQMLGRIRAALSRDIAAGFSIGTNVRAALAEDAEERRKRGWPLGLTAADLERLGEPA